ncbi:MAG: hypothetical protein IKE42_15355 [Aquamicrobium sp.]|nr:hypothetical protein [Aquamicrobium sp.]
MASLASEIFDLIQTNTPEVRSGNPAQCGIAVGALATNLGAILTAIKLHRGEAMMQLCAEHAVRLMLESEDDILGKVLQQLPARNTRPS